MSTRSNTGDAADRERDHARRMDALGRLAGGVAHDFNNLLTSIRGLGALVLEDMGANHPSRPDLEEILKAAQRATELTGELLAFSGRQRMEDGIVDLNALVHGVAQRVRGRHPAVDLRVTTEPSLPPVAADAEKLRQAVENLLTSAANASEASGSVRVETGLTSLAEGSVPTLPAADYAFISVHDDGPLTPEQVDAVFEPFAAPRSAARGTGLTLAVAYGIIRRAGGFLVATARADGLTLTAYVPLASRSERPA